MTLKEYLKTQDPINTIEKVDSIFLFVKTNRISFNESVDYEILLAIKKLSIQKYYVNNKPDYDFKHQHNVSMPPTTYFSKTKRVEIQLMKDELKHGGRNKRAIINKALKDKLLKTDGKRKGQKNRHGTEEHPDMGKQYTPDWALKKLAKNGRDYSYRHPTIENAIKKATNRTKEQQEIFDMKNKPHIIYTPMGGQNKR